MRAELDRLRVQVGELVAKHEQTRDIAEFSKYESDPVGFIRNVLRADPWSKQEEMTELVRDNARTVVLSANGIGKDWACARLAIWWVYARRGLCILTGPTQRQVQHILMREVRRSFTAAPELPGELYALELRVADSGESGILAFTSDNADRLTGYHHPRLLICITEGQGVEEAAFEAASACITGPENRLLVYGNPTRPTGPFYRAAHSDNWAKLRVPAHEHPNVITGREEIPGGVSREWVESMALEYGPNSSIYRSRVEALFPEESVEGLVSRRMLREAFERFVDPDFDRGDAHLLPEPIMALDVARFGLDKSALAVVQGPIVREIVTWGQAALTTTVERVIEHGRRIRDRDIYGRTPTVWVDEPGLGGGCIDMLEAKGYPTVGFNGAKRASHPSRWLNRRAESHWFLRTVLESGKVALPPDRVLEEEALAVEWQVNAAGQIQILGKDLIRKELGGRSPDRLDAVVIGLSASLGGIRAPTISFQHVRI